MFVGRDRELKRLRRLQGKNCASLVVIRGRRRIGKSRLIAEFGKGCTCHILSGLPPTSKTTKQSQLDEFCSQISDLFDVPEFRVTGWRAAFRRLCDLCTEEQTVLALDEISWIGSADSDFLGQLKNAWDLFFSSKPNLVLIICGSVSSWIEKNILSSTGFVGRISWIYICRSFRLRTHVDSGVRMRTG